MSETIADVLTAADIQGLIEGCESYDAEGYHLFRAPGEPGYIEGASTSAGRVADDLGVDDSSDDYEGWTGEQLRRWGTRYCQAAITEALAVIEIGWHGNELIGTCGQVLHVDPAELASAACSLAWERWCGAAMETIEHARQIAGE